MCFSCVTNDIFECDKLVGTQNGHTPKMIEPILLHLKGLYHSVHTDVQKKKKKSNSSPCFNNAVLSSMLVLYHIFLDGHLCHQ